MMLILLTGVIIFAFELFRFSINWLSDLIEKILIEK